MRRVLSQFLLVLIAFALVGGTTAQLALSVQPVAPMTMTGTPCNMMTSAIDGSHGQPMTPCKGVTPDCIKQMGCVTNPALPARITDNEIIAHSSRVAYGMVLSRLAGLITTPEPNPPRTI